MTARIPEYLKRPEWRRGTKGNRASTGMPKPAPRERWNTVVNLPGEKWRLVDNGKYAVSNMGRIKRAGYEYIVNPCKSSGYLSVYLEKVNGKKRYILLHRAILELFVGPPPSPEHEATHLDGIPTNCRLDNLIWVTKKENSAHRDFHKIHGKGVKYPLAAILSKWEPK